MKKLIYLFGLLSILNANGQSITLLPGNGGEGNIISNSTDPIVRIYGPTAPQVTKMLFSVSDVAPNTGLQFTNYNDYRKFNFIHSGSSVLTVDLNNQKVGIDNFAPTYKLDVNGDINTTGTFRVNGVPISQEPFYYYASPWMTSPTASVDQVVDGTCMRTRKIAVPELTTEMINGAEVTVYMRVGSLGPYQLPYISDAGGATNQINFNINYPGDITIYRHTFNTCRFNSGSPESYPGQPILVNLPQIIEYRVVIIKK